MTTPRREDTATRSARRVRAGDVDPAALSALAGRTFPLACPAELDPADVTDFVATHLTPAVFADHLDDPSAYVYLSGSTETPDGYALVLHGSHPDAPGDWSALRSAYVSKLYVDPDLHGGGVAGALMTAALVDAAADGCAAAWLGTNRNNVRAKRFYVKLGFEIVAERRFRVGSVDCVDDVLLRVL